MTDMPRMTQFEVDAYNFKRKQVEAITESKGEPCDKESHLRDQILAWCNQQSPRWKVIYARSDKPSTIGIGINDLTLLLPNGKVHLIELKTRLGKLSIEQMAWAKECEMLGHTAHVVRSMDEFLKVIHL